MKKKRKKEKKDKLVELVGGGSVINGAYLVLFIYMNKLKKILILSIFSQTMSPNRCVDRSRLGSALAWNGLYTLYDLKLTKHGLIN